MPGLGFHHQCGLKLKEKNPESSGGFDRRDAMLNEEYEEEAGLLMSWQ